MSAQRNPNSATGLRPTVPGADTGHSFPLSSPAAVNSPITVTVDGKPTEVLGAVGVSDSLDCYQVNFRVRPGNSNRSGYHPGGRHRGLLERS
jgi:uncharacterized protein (TIGR03437 family)